jgi:cation diffusion facilitator CzcD-associated flavoprotein CzcO
VDARQVSVIRHDVVIVGAAGVAITSELRRAGITDYVTLDREPISTAFDDDTDTWTLTSRGGPASRGRVVIDHRPHLHPWMPDLPGHNAFRGVAVHAAACAPDVEPTSRRVAVIGVDTAGGQLIDRLSARASAIEVFPYPPRRVIPTIGRRRRRRPSGQPSVQLVTSPIVVTSPIDTLTASGIRTRDGAHHDADAIVYATGYAIAGRGHTLLGTGGLTVEQAWRDGMEPYRGVAVHGFPNYFLITGPRETDAGAQVRYIVECLQLMNGHSRIEVRRSTQQVFNERVHLRRAEHRLTASAFDFSSPAAAHDDTYDGPATLTLAGTRHQVRVRLTGHLDPIDGQYHWQGTVFATLPAQLLKQTRAVTLAVEQRSASARITEQSPQGTHSIAGVGAPPFALDDVDVRVPAL